MSPLALPIAGLVAVLGWECLPTSVDPAPMPAPVTQTAAGPAAPPPIADWTDIALARPLFAPDRRPVPGAAGAQDGLPRLTGIIRSDDAHLAIFAMPGATPDAAGKSLVVPQAAVVAGWVVSDIGDGAVTLTQGSRSALLRLSFTNVPVSAPAPPAKTGPVLLHEKRTSPFLQW